MYIYTHMHIKIYICIQHNVFNPFGRQETYYLRNLCHNGKDLETDRDSAYWCKAYSIQELQMCCRYICFEENVMMQSH